MSEQPNNNDEIHSDHDEEEDKDVVLADDNMM